MKKILLTSFICLFCLPWVLAQQRNVSGKVTSAEDGSSLPGVNVVLKGTTSGTVTDANGEFVVSVPAEGGVLIFSFIGLSSQELEIGTRTVVGVAMAQDVTQLGEVVVTAVGIERDKRSLGYAVQSVQSKDIVNARESNIVNSLAGKIAGVQLIHPAGKPDLPLALSFAVTLL